jgi:phospholipid/cholesterol/gamma-HCH transport system ATP-binding protein
MDDNIAVELRNVAVKFGSTVVHRDISFTVNEGQSVTLLGPSGTGKTVLLKLMMGLMQPTSGQVIVLGQEIGSLNQTQLRDLRKNVGMLFQGAALFDSLSVYENIAYPLRERGECSEARISNTVEETLSIVGLPELGQRFPSQLSGGQKKRVGLARALASSPRVVLFDEPTTGLDPTATRLIDDLIIKLKSQFGITCISVTHDIASAKRVSDRWILLNKGVVAADGPVENVLHESKAVLDFTSGNWKDEEYPVQEMEGTDL